MTTFVLDLDGTLYREALPIPGARGAVEEMRAAGHRVVFLTNDATMTRRRRAAHLTAMGIEAHAEDVITAAAAAASFVKALEPPARTVMVLGSAAVEEELLDAIPGLVVIEPGGDAAERVDAVVVGLDERLSLDRLGAAHAAIGDGAHFLATNADRAYPRAGGGTAPGAGAIVAALETSTARTATVVGKPHRFMILLAAELCGVDAVSLVVVGDSASDVAAARLCGATSVLVLTGMVTDAAELTVRPDIVVPSIADVLDAVKSAPEPVSPLS